MINKIVKFFSKETWTLDFSYYHDDHVTWVEIYRNDTPEQIFVKEEEAMDWTERLRDGSLLKEKIFGKILKIHFRMYYDKKLVYEYFWIRKTKDTKVSSRIIDLDEKIYY